MTSNVYVSFIPYALEMGVPFFYYGDSNHVYMDNKGDNSAKLGRRKLENYKIENFIVLQTTSPLRTSDNIDAAITLFKEKKAYSVISYCKEHHPVYWHKYLNSEVKLESIFDDKLQNRQDLRPTYFPNGAIYVLPKSVLESRNYRSKNTYVYLMDRTTSVDVDSIEDFKYLTYLITNNNDL